MRERDESVCLSVCQSVSLSVCQSVSLSVCLSVCLCPGQIGMVWDIHIGMVWDIQIGMNKYQFAQTQPNALCTLRCCASTRSKCLIVYCTHWHFSSFVNVLNSCLQSLIPLPTHCNLAFSPSHSENDTVKSSINDPPNEYPRTLRIPDTYIAKIAKNLWTNCNSANKQSFQNLTKSLFSQCSLDLKSEFDLLQQILLLKCYCTFYIYGALAKKAFCHIFKRWFIGLITGQSAKKLQIFAILAS